MCKFRGFLIIYSSNFLVLPTMLLLRRIHLSHQLHLSYINTNKQSNFKVGLFSYESSFQKAETPFTFYRSREMHSLLLFTETRLAF